MGLSPYSSPNDAGVLCVILVNTAISISIVKDMVRSFLSIIGIRISSWEDYSIDGTMMDNTLECRGTPSESYMEEFRHQTPAIRYDSMCAASKNHPEQQECSVCLTEFAPEAEINRLPCGHVFHMACLEKWLKYWNLTCPLCRNNMIAPQVGEEDDGCPPM